jgi:hypothetical protein
MEMGEEPRNQIAAENQEKQVAAGATRVSLSAVIVAVVIAVAVFGWLLAR